MVDAAGNLVGCSWSSLPDTSNGWWVTASSGSGSTLITVSAPPNALIANGYEVRYQYIYYGPAPGPGMPPPPPNFQASAYFNVTAASGFTPIRIDAGSNSNYTDTLGALWAADTDFSGGSAISTASAITGTADQPLYQAQRAGSSFSYSIPIANGTYAVTLDFAEIEYTGVGQGVFTVTAGGNTVLSNFDIFAAAGGANKATSRTFLVKATGGQINLGFNATTGNAALAAIYVGLPGGGTPAIEGAANPPLPAWQDDVRPTDEGAGALSGGFGPSAGDSVDLVTGTYENHPGPDIVVRNPVGPDALFERLYRSAQAAAGASSPGLTPGWTHVFDAKISGPASGWGPLTLTYPNGATDTLTPTLDGSGNPTGAFTVPSGAPYYVTGTASATAGQWNAITITQEDESAQIFHPATAGAATLRLDQIENQLSQTLNLSFDAAGRLSAISNDASPAATLLSFTYDSGTGYLIRADDAYGRRVTFTNATAGGSTNLTQVSQISDPAAGTPLTRWVYDYTAIGGQPYLFSVGVPDPTGGSTGMKTHPITYDTPAGSSVPYVRFITDGNGNIRTYTYNAGGGTTDVSVYNADGTPSLKWTENFSAASRKSTGTTDAAGNSTGLVYADSSNPTLPTTATNENGQAATVTYSPTYHKPTQVQVPSNGATLTTTLGYDASEFPLGRLASAQTGGKGASTFTYYTAADRLKGLIKTVTTPAPGSTGIGGSTVTTTYTYTSHGNIQAVVLPAPNSTAGATVTYTYNYTDDSAFTPDPATAIEALGEPLSITDPLGNAVHLRYDGRGNLVRHYDGRGVLTQFAYNPADQLTDVLYPATGMTGTGQGRVHYDYYGVGGDLMDTQIYDESGALFRQINAGRGAEAEGKQTTGNTPQVTLSKEGMFRITGIADGNGNTTAHSYDNVSNLTKLEFPLHDTIQFPSLADGGHDPAGNLLKRIDGRGVTMTLTRASDDSRVTGVGYDGAFSAKSAGYQYDVYGRVTQVTDNAGTIAYTYDDRDEILTATTTYHNVAAPGTDLPAQTISYGYYPDGSRASLTLPSVTGASGGTSTFSYTYDNAGRLTHVGAPWTGGSYNYTYDNADRLTQQTTARVVTTYGYDDKNELTSLSNTVGLLTSPYHVNFTSLVYDAAGNRVSATVTADAAGSAPSASGAYTWTYDSKDRLTGESRTCPASALLAFSASWAYDDPGNATTLRGVSASYNADNQLTSGASFLYDGDGNPTTYAGAALAFDEEDHVLTLPGLSGGIADSLYRSDGLRAYKTAATSGVTTYYIYDGDRLLYELDNSGTGSTFTITSTYGYGAVGLAQRFQKSTGKYTCFAYDPQGSVVERFGQTDSQPADVALYDAYGGLRADISTAASLGPYTYPAQTAYSIGFGGQWGYYTDPTTRASNSDSGFILCGQRWYDPLNCRWLTRDPILYDGGINVYGFCGGNPVTGADPSGLDPEESLTIRLLYFIGEHTRKPVREISKAEAVRLIKASAVRNAEEAAAAGARETAANISIEGGTSAQRYRLGKEIATKGYGKGNVDFHDVRIHEQPVDHPRPHFQSLRGTHRGHIFISLAPIAAFFSHITLKNVVEFIDPTPITSTKDAAVAAAHWLKPRTDRERGALAQKRIGRWTGAKPGDDDYDDTY